MSFERWQLADRAVCTQATAQTHVIAHLEGPQPQRQLRLGEDLVEGADELQVGIDENTNEK